MWIELYKICTKAHAAIIICYFSFLLIFFLVQIVSYIADKNGYRPTVEYIGKGVHPPPPPEYAHVKVPKILEPVELAPIVKPMATPQPVPILATAGPIGYGAHAPVQEYDPIKIKFNSLPVNGPLPVLDPYAVGYGYGYGQYGQGYLDPVFAASTNANKISRKRALLYNRTLFRKDVEKRAAIKKKISKSN